MKLCGDGACFFVRYAGDVVEAARPADDVKDVAVAIAAGQLAHEVDSDALEWHVVELAHLLSSVLEDLVAFEQAHLAQSNVFLDVLDHVLPVDFLPDDGKRGLDTGVTVDR